MRDMLDILLAAGWRELVGDLFVLALIGFDLWLVLVLFGGPQG